MVILVPSRSETRQDSGTSCELNLMEWTCDSSAVFWRQFVWTRCSSASRMNSELPGRKRCCSYFSLQVREDSRSLSSAKTHVLPFYSSRLRSTNSCTQVSTVFMVSWALLKFDVAFPSSPAKKVHSEIPPLVQELHRFQTGASVRAKGQIWSPFTQEEDLQMYRWLMLRLEKQWTRSWRCSFWTLQRDTKSRYTS